LNDHPAEFNENLPIGLKVVSGEHTEGQTDVQIGDLLSFPFICLKEGRLKITSM
jgi:hypothetical protein